jgi:hypothetical protein
MQVKNDQILNITELVLNSDKFELDRELSDWYQDEDELGNFHAIVFLNSKITGKRIFEWQLVVHLDLDDLYSTYRALHRNGTPKFETDFTKETEFMRGFMEIHGFNILPYLKEFNGVVDAYAKIAELVDGNEELPGAYGAMFGNKFGI